MKHKMVVAVMGIVVSAGMPVAYGAGAVAAGGGGAAAGGGHASGGAVSTGGGGGGHAGGAGGAVGSGSGVAPPIHVANNPPANAGNNGGGTTTPPTSPPANGGGTNNGNSNGNSNGPSQNREQNRGYPYVAYPYSPFGYGNGYGGDYNNGYGNNGIANTNNSQASVDNSTSATSATVSTDNGNSAPLVTPADPNAASAAAKMQNAANHSPQLLALQSEVHRDQQDYDAARERVLAHLRQQPDYQKAVENRRDAGAQVRSTKQSAPANTNAVVSAAESKLQAGDAVTKMEQYAVDQDPAAAAAKSKLATAMTKLAAMRGSAGVK